MKEKPLTEIIEEMRAMAEILVPFNFPRVPPTAEDEVGSLKSREMIVDGYSLTLHFARSDYGDYFMETLQVYGQISPFLPFALVCKLAKKVLGDHHLSLVEFWKDNRKIYCWTVCLNLDGKPISPPYDVDVEHCSFEGLQYDYMQPDQVNFY